MGTFERYLSGWVGLCIVIGVALGNFLPQFFAALAGLEVAGVNLVVAALIWIWIYPMMCRWILVRFATLDDDPRV